jgi:hypothetical protein
MDRDQAFRYGVGFIKGSIFISAAVLGLNSINLHPSQKDIEAQVALSGKLVAQEFRGDEIISVTSEELHKYRPYLLKMTSSDPHSDILSETAQAIGGVSRDFVDQSWRYEPVSVRSEVKARVTSCTYAVYLASGIRSEEVRQAPVMKIARLLKSSVTQGKKIAMDSGWKVGCDRALAQR